MLQFSEESSTNRLKGFKCGVQEMDNFIRDSLDGYLKEHPNYQLYIAVDDEQGIVALFVVSSGIFVDNDGEYQDLPLGKPWSYFDEDFQIQYGTMYPSLEIDYLAVRNDLRNKGYGSRIIKELSSRARTKNYYFLTVNAYHTKGYSAIPFYEKQGFFALQEYSEDFDTLRMAMRV